MSISRHLSLSLLFYSLLSYVLHVHYEGCVGGSVNFNYIIPGFFFLLLLCHISYRSSPITSNQASFLFSVALGGRVRRDITAARPDTNYTIH